MTLVRAVYEFWAESDAEMSFQIGDIITVTNQDDAGWWEGELQGQRGLFPSNYVESYTPINNFRTKVIVPPPPPSTTTTSTWQTINNNTSSWQTNNNNNTSTWQTNNNTSWQSKPPTAGNNNNYIPSWQTSAITNNRLRMNTVPVNDTPPPPPTNTNHFNTVQQQPSWAAPVTTPWNNSQNTSNINSTYTNSNNNINNTQNSTNKYNTKGWDQQIQWQRSDSQVAAQVDNDWTSGHGMPDATSAKFVLKKPANLDTYNNILNVYKTPTIKETDETTTTPAAPKTETIPKKEEAVKKPAAAASSSPATYQKRAKVSPTKFGLWASNLAEYTGRAMIVTGFLSIVWYLADVERFGELVLYGGIYNIIVGFGIVIYEKTPYGQTRGESRIPIRSLVYMSLSIFQFLNYPTLLTGLFCLITSGVNLLATIKQEVYDPIPKAAHSAKEMSYFQDLYSYLVSIKQQNKVGVLVFVGVYLFANVFIYFNALYFYINFVDQTIQATNNNGPSWWFPYAKGFGNTLDFNSSIIVLPICRTFLRMLYNRSTADQGTVARILRGILYFIPIDKNLAFHILVARGVMVGAIGHTFFHFMNFAFAPTFTYNTFGLAPFLTGGILCITCLLIFTAAKDNTRRGQFEVFWYSHHAFIVFFIIQLFHGRGMINPNYWKWFALPGTLYLLERCLRIYRANQKVVVLSVTMMDDVFSLEFAKTGVFETPYKEGQYMFIQSPAISRIQWHPFTISSAPQDPSVTVHIRVQGEGSWTRGLREYIGSMGPRKKPYFQLDRQGPGGKLQGKILGPDGQPMLCIDGPHSAPTQHLGEYSAVIIAGAGIGVTPVAAALKSVVFHRWKYFVGQCYPDHAYFVWVCAHKDINAFRWLIRIIKDAQDEVTHMRATNPQNMASKTFEFHIYISSVPKDVKPIDVVIDDEVGFWGVPREDAKVDKIRCNWDEADLYRTMMCPQKHTELGDVHIWNGRPEWDPRFEQISRNHPNIDIGVMFCGNPMIGKDLRRQCFVHSKNRTQGIFKLHKENF